MNGFFIFLIGCAVGSTVSFVILALLTASKERDDEIDL